MLWFDRHRRFRARLSGYIDAQISPKEALAVEAHLEGCDACRLELEGIRATVMAMRDLPQMDIPRSFTLSSRQVARPMPPTLPSTPPLTIGMRLAGTALAFTLAVVLVADFGDFSGNGGRDSAATQESGNDDANALRLSVEDDDSRASAAPDAPLGEANDESKTLGGGDADVECSVVTHSNGPFDSAQDATATSVPEAITDATPAPAAVGRSDDFSCEADGFGAYSAASPTLDPIAELQGPIEKDLEFDRSSDAKGNLSPLRFLEIALAAALFVVLAGLAGAVSAARRR